MRIYTRAEWGARPPTKVMGHYPKKGFIIHHTASGHNVPQSEAADLNYQYACQGWHIKEHDATDILQGWTVFPSARIVEGRMPWDSDNGAIYNWGGGAVDYVGIECDGTFDGDDFMGDVQYASLVWLCAENVRRGVVPVNFEIKGHRQVYPCRPGDKKSTGCPGNLLEQFVTNLKLFKDIKAALKDTPATKPREVDMQVRQLDNVTEAVWTDCYKNKADYYVTTDGTTAHLTFKLEGHKPFGGSGTTEGQKVSGIQDHNIQDILGQEHMKEIKGSYKLTVACSSPITISIREVPK